MNNDINKLEKVEESKKTSDEILRSMSEDMLRALASVQDGPVGLALRHYVDQREIDVAKQIANLSKFPQEKSWGTLFALQDLQSKLTELKRILKVFKDAQKLANKRFRTAKASS